MDGGDSAGGSNGLAVLIDRYGEELLGDFQQYYGINLVLALDYCSGYSPKHILSLISQLPDESRTTAALRGGVQYRGWTIDRYMLANLIDAVMDNTYATVAANAKKKPKRPKSSYRPSKAESRGNDNQFAVIARQKLAAVKKAKGV